MRQFLENNARILELGFVFIGVIFSAYTIYQISVQNEINGKQAELLATSTALANRIAIAENITPSFVVTNERPILEKNALGYSFDVLNLSKRPLVVENAWNFSLWDCVNQEEITGLDENSIDIEEMLIDKIYMRTIPRDRTGEDLRVFLSKDNFPNTFKRMKNSRGNFILVLRAYISLEDADEFTKILRGMEESIDSSQNDIKTRQITRSGYFGLTFNYSDGNFTQIVDEECGEWVLGDSQ